MKLLFQQIFNEEFYKMSTCPNSCLTSLDGCRVGFCEEMDTGNVHMNTNICVDTNAWTFWYGNQSLKNIGFYLFLQKHWANFYQIHVFYHQECSIIQKIILENLSCIWLSHFDLNWEKNIMKSLAHVLQISYERMPHIESVILLVSNGVLKSFWLAAGRWGFPHWGIILKGENYPFWI